MLAMPDPMKLYCFWSVAACFRFDLNPDVTETEWGVTVTLDFALLFTETVPLASCVEGWF